MSDSRVLFEFRADASNIQKTLNGIDEHLVATSEKAENIGTSFNQSGNIAKQSGKMMKDGSNQAMTAVTGLNWAISDMPYLFQNTRMGIMAVSNNITPLVQNIAYLQKTTGSFKGALKSMLTVFTGPMGVVFAITAVIAIVQTLSFIMAKQKDKTDSATASNKEFANSLREIANTTSIDALMSQLDEGDKQIRLAKLRNSLLENEQEKANDYYKNIKDLKEVLWGGIGMSSLDDNPYVHIPWTEARDKLKSYEEKAEDFIELFKKAHPEADIKKFNLSKVVEWYDEEIDRNESIIKQEEIKKEERNKQIDQNRTIGEASEKQIRYEERKEEFRISQLGINEQITEWELKRAELQALILEMTSKGEKTEAEILEQKEKLLEIEQKIYALGQKKKQESTTSGIDPGLESAQKEAEAKRIAYLQIKQAHDLFIQGIDTSSDEYLQNQIDRIQAEIAATEAGTKERMLLEAQLDDIRVKLVKNQMDRAKSLIDEEIEYERRLAGVIADGGLESVYEQMFSRIKQQFLQFWLDRLGITRAMMNMENAIVYIGQGKLDAAKEAFHQRDMTRMAEEASAAAVSAGVKGTESAAGIPFPGNIAAIGLVLASVFSALQKSKVTGRQIVAAAEGAIINKPTLLLAGEALHRSGTEIVMPERNFNRYMEKEIIPGIMAKVNINNGGLESRLERVESAIYSIGRQIPGETGKAVKRALRGRF